MSHPWFLRLLCRLRLHALRASPLPPPPPLLFFAQIKAELSLARHFAFPSVGSASDPRAEATAQVHAQVYMMCTCIHADMHWHIITYAQAHVDMQLYAYTRAQHG